MYLGGWQKGKARDDSVNDNFSAFAVRAITEDFAIDHKEIGVAMWLPWRELLAAWRDAGRPADGKITPLDGCKGLPDGKPTDAMQEHFQIQVASLCVCVLVELRLGFINNAYASLIFHIVHMLLLHIFTQHQLGCNHW